MFGRFQGWLRRHEMLVDAISVAPFLLLYAGTILNYAAIEQAPVPPRLPIALALLLPLAWRRTYPAPVFAVIAAAAAVQLGLGIGPFSADLAVVIALYTVAVRCGWAWALTALGTIEVGLVLALVRFPYSDWDDWRTFAAYTFLILLCWVSGLYMKVRRRYYLGLEERTRRLEREREARAQAAVAEERERIAREMHDVVAHNLSVIVVQAEGASYAIGYDTDRAKGALETIAATGRAALAEVRGIVGVLREGEEEYAPQPGLNELDQVVERVRAAGLPVEFTITGNQRPLTRGVEMAAYRVVQEALTNTIKHAGPSVRRVQVHLGYGSHVLDLRVLDDGRGESAQQAAENGRGNGLIGMRERVSVYGGSLQTGPRAEGGFEVAATLPLRPGTRAHAEENHGFTG
ncbi:sensor histidine kinase [Nocardiopsis sp. HUAS JQ3]|uniref:sensor histidine kinase n=1 Tax=Nocardiopsis sp. HUAS JQ3 TaxID=3061629 RepID=UPI0023A9DA08|nr:histidine kinase [Nocardiopsis sp. HUAS JQ3]WDZ90609.1 histidine kinase [Nocardiopsis sp. HUAS JQ3]